MLFFICDVWPLQLLINNPVFYYIFINDVTTHVDRNTTIKLFADDIKIYTDLPNISPTNLQTQLNNIHQWSSTWQMQISYSKCNIVHIGSLNSPHNLHIHNIPIKQVVSVVDLGVTIDEHLRFKIHINTIIQKAIQRSALIKRCFLSRNATNLLRACKTCLSDRHLNTPQQPGHLHTSHKSPK